MSKTKNYRHCRLRKENTDTVSYIPEQHAFLGRTLSLKIDGVWETGWKVVSAGPLVVAEIAEALEHAFSRIWKPSTDLTTRGRK